MRMEYRAVKERRNIKIKCLMAKKIYIRDKIKNRSKKGEQKYETNKYMDKRRLS